MLVTDIIDPMELQAFVREIDPRAYGFTLQDQLPHRERNQVEFAFRRFDRTRAEEASYRPFDVESPIGSRKGFARVTGEIPPLSKKQTLGEELTIKLAEMRGGAGQGSTEIVDQIFDDAADLTESILARLERAKGEALSTGKVTFTNDRGLVDAEIDFTVGGAFPLTALSGPSALWSVHASATPIADMIGWVKEWRDANQGRNPAYFQMSLEALQNAVQADEVKNYLAVPGGITPPIVTEANLQQINLSLGLPPIRTYDTETNVPGVGDTRVIPAEKVLLLPAASERDFGETTFGPTAEALELVGAGFGTVETAPGLTGVVMKTFDPVSTWTKVAGLAIPVIKNPSAIGETDVLA